jgi:hypothetical protein
MSETSNVKKLAKLGRFPLTTEASTVTGKTVRITQRNQQTGTEYSVYVTPAELAAFSAAAESFGGKS